MSAKLHRSNTNFQIAYFIAGRCHTADAAYIELLNLREDREAALNMAKSYQFGQFKTLRHVILPQLHPFLMSATRSGIALIWKIILMVELLGRSNGMGYQLHLFFQWFDIASILAYTIAFVGVIQLIEFALLKPIDNIAKRWRL